MLFFFSEFEPFNDCISALWNKCEAVKQVTQNLWLPVVKVMQCSCNMTNKIEEQGEVKVKVGEE